MNVGGQQGRPPSITDPGIGGSADKSPRVGNKIGTSEDTFAVYLGGVEYPLDASLVWRYAAKDALIGPQVPAVEQFRKILGEAEKQHQQKP
jgi:hypothetical protein